MNGSNNSFNYNLFHMREVAHFDKPIENYATTAAPLSILVSFSSLFCCFGFLGCNRKL